MSFSDDMKRFNVKVEARYRAAFVGITEEVQRSVVEGSEITGAPGQPVDTGYLKSSWIPRFTSPSSWVIETNAKYAKSIEDGISYSHGGTGMTLRSEVGGWHSVKITIAGFQRIVDHVVRQVKESV